MATRRAVLASAAALMAPAIVSTAPAVAAAPDAELIRLGQEFAEAFAVWHQANTVWRDAEREFEAAHWAAHPLPPSRADQDAWLAQFMRAYEATSAAAASAENERRLNVCDVIAAQIRAIRPTTLAGLAAHAKVARFDGFTLQVLEQKRADLDHPDIAVLGFLDLVEGLAS